MEHYGHLLALPSVWSLFGIFDSDSMTGHNEHELAISVGWSDFGRIRTQFGTVVEDIYLRNAHVLEKMVIMEEVFKDYEPPRWKFASVANR